MIIEPAHSRRRRARKARLWVAILAAFALLVGGALGAAAFAWPSPRLADSDVALARVVLPGFAGSVTGIRVRSADGQRVRIRLAHGRLLPRHRLDGGERLTVRLSVQRPGWASWLVGRTEQRTLTIETPAPRVLHRWLRVREGDPVAVAFAQPVSWIRIGDAHARRLSQPSTVVPVGVIASGAHIAGAIEVAAAVRPWERLSPSVPVSWFPSRPVAQLYVDPAPGATVGLQRQLTLTFSRPVRDVLGTRRPRLSPRTQGSWRLLDARTLAFRPSGFGFGFGATVKIELPQNVLLTGEESTRLTRSLDWHVRTGSTLRLQQLLAELGYLPVDWQLTSDPAPSLAAQLREAVTPPPGRFSWRYSNTPRVLHELWRPGRWTEIIRGAVMMFEDTHGLATDGVAGPHVWRKLIADAINGKRRDDGYSFVFVHQSIPQSLNLWHNGRVIVSSPGNTGIAAAPTQNGTFAVYSHIPVGTMSGTNPDGTHYHDPGIRYISYFNGGDAIHAFNRASFGTPQSLGCVELPLDAAARVWPFTPIGTLVTIEG